MWFYKLLNYLLGKIAEVFCAFKMYEILMLNCFDSKNKPMLQFKVLT